MGRGTRVREEQASWISQWVQDVDGPSQIQPLPEPAGARRPASSWRITTRLAPHARRRDVSAETRAPSVYPPAYIDASRRSRIASGSLNAMKRAERPGLHRWSRHEYGQLIDHGLLDEDDPIELLDGLLLVKEPQHSPHRTSASFGARRATTPPHIRPTRRSSSRSRSRACPSPAAAKPRHMPVRESRTTGFSTWATACWKSIVSRRTRARHGGTGAIWRSKRWAPAPRSRRSPRQRRPSASPISCRNPRSDRKAVRRPNPSSAPAPRRGRS